MRSKFFVATIIALIISISGFAQDKINLSNGGVIDAKVKEVGTKTITYRKTNNPTGPDFVINKSEVESITYANGTTDEIEETDDMDDDRRLLVRRAHHRFGLSQEQYPKNILSIAPMQMANEGPAGVGLHYERVIDKRSIFSFYLPFAAIFYSDYENTNNLGSKKTTHTFCYFYPGVKIYPTGSNRRVSYGVGPSIALGFGNKNVYEYNGGSGVYREKSVFKSGLLINNSLNIQPTKHLYIGLELGLGFTYYNNENDYYNSNTFDSDAPLVQFNFAIGYRF